MEAMRASEKFVKYQIAWRHVQNGSALQEITYLEEDYIDYCKRYAVITLHNEGLHNLYSSQNIVMAVQ
jgi:hypothetical protein